VEGGVPILQKVVLGTDCAFLMGYVIENERFTKADDHSRLVFTVHKVGLAGNSKRTVLDRRRGARGENKKDARGRGRRWRTLSEGHQPLIVMV
jgi:hypothetical protein